MVDLLSIRWSITINASSSLQDYRAVILLCSTQAMSLDHLCQVEVRNGDYALAAIETINEKHGVLATMLLFLY
jgi:hypothetical protein